MTSAAEDDQFRQARIFDRYQQGQPPVVNRPAVADDEVKPLLDYLDQAPDFQVERGFRRDVIDGREDVPGAFFTDGTWIWSADVQHYLRKHGIPPEPDLVDHIRGQGFRVPEVDDLTVARAESVITGEPVSLPPVELRLTNREHELLLALERRILEYGVPLNAFLFRRSADGPWCLERRAAGWQVTRYDNGRPVDPVVFERLGDAGAHLLGVLLTDAERVRRTAPNVPETQAVLDDWPIQPQGGDPPLTLFTDKRIVVAPPGTYLIRYGDQTGNLTFADNTPFEAMSLRAQLLREGPHRYRVQRPLYVLTGTTVPWHGQPGGGTVYLLPRSIQQHLAAGSITQTGAPPR